MRTTSLPFMLAALLATLPAAAEDDTFPGVEKLMTPAEYEAAGLGKLTPQEREALDAWLVRYTANEAPVIRRTNEAVQAAEKESRIESRIRQPFTGWSGDTVFYLENGQVWRQRLRGRKAYNGDDTRVVIEKNLFGFYVMTHVASGSAVGVTRVK